MKLLLCQDAKAQLVLGRNRRDDFIVTTKDENSSTRVITEILPLRSVQGQNDIKPSVSYFQGNEIML